MDNVEKMSAFFEKNGISVLEISSFKRSCLHRVQACVEASFNVILTASLSYVLRVTNFQIALLATQADDVLCTCEAIAAFLKMLIASNLGIVIFQSFAVLEGIVRLSNAIASITNGAMLTGPSSVTGQVTLLFGRLNKIPQARWPRILAALTAQVILCDTLPAVLAALDASGIPEDRWAALLSTEGVVNAIAAGVLPTVLAALTASAIPKDAWVKLLSTHGVVNAIAAGVLPTVLANMTKSGIPRVYWDKILSRHGVINFLASDEKMRTIFEALGMSGIPVDAWNILFATVTAMICVLVYREQECVCLCVCVYVVYTHTHTHTHTHLHTHTHTHSHTQTVPRTDWSSCTRRQQATAFDSGANASLGIGHGWTGRDIHLTCVLGLDFHSTL